MEHIISKDGTRIGFERCGAGLPLLLVHGATADHRRWAKVLPHFEQHFTVYAMDRRGRGGSGDAPAYAFLREAEDVAAVVEAASQQTGHPVALLGHSFGGLCSLEAALLTDKIRKLILYEPPLPIGLPLYAPDFPDRLQEQIERGALESALELFIREEVKMPERELEIYRSLPMWKERIKLVPTLLREIVLDRSYEFDAARFAGLRIPTLLLLGSDSPVIFSQAITALNAALDCSQVVKMSGQQHIAMDTNPDLFVREVLQFLETDA